MMKIAFDLNKRNDLFLIPQSISERNNKPIACANLAFQGNNEILLDKKSGIVQKEVENPDGTRSIIVCNKEGGICARATDEFRNKVADIEFMSGKSGPASAILKPKGEKFKDLRILLIGDSSLKSNKKNGILAEVFNEPVYKQSKPIFFTGNLTVVTGKDRSPESAENAFHSFIDSKLYESYLPNGFNQDKYSEFDTFLPCAGNATRLRDATTLSRNNEEAYINKASMPLPAKIEGRTADNKKTFKNYQLVHDTLGNLSVIGVINNKTKLDLIREEKPNGSASGLILALKNNSIDLTKPLIVRFCDSISDIDFSKTLDDFKAKRSALMVVGKAFDKDMLKSVGGISTRGKTEDISGETRHSMEITDYKEKPGIGPEGDMALISNVDEKYDGKYLGSIGMFVFSPESLRWIKNKSDNDPNAFKDDENEIDFSKGIIPELITACQNDQLQRAGKPLRMHAHITDGNFNDVGTTKAYIEEIKEQASKSKNKPAKNIYESIRQQYKDNLTSEGVVCMPGTKKLFEEFCHKNNLKPQGNIIVTSQKLNNSL